MATLASATRREDTLPLVTEVQSWSDWFATPAYYLASYATDPICYAKEFWWRAKIVDDVYPDASNIEKCARRVFLGICATGCVVMSPLAILGLALRPLAIYLQSQPFRYLHGRGLEKPLGDEFTMHSWNILGVRAENVITDGGASPIQFRIDRIANEILNKNANLNCLYEVFDIQTAKALYRRLEPYYAHFYFHMGARTIGVPSGMMVISNLKINNPEFHPFSQDMLDDRAQYSGKGIFKMGLGAGRASVYSTHLQHSEICIEPTDGEKLAKRVEMAMIVNLMERDPADAVILTGDLNSSAQEFRDYEWEADFGAVDNEITWDGDAWCAGLTGKQPSPPLKFDYTRVFREKGAVLEREIVPNGFDGTRYKDEALSDHRALFCRIKV